MGSGSIHFIHCADLHLDSRMESQLTHFQAQERRQELLQTFYRMAQYARQHQVRAIMISGDFFDTVQVSGTTFRTVFRTMQSFSDVDFLYLPGNHDWQLEMFSRQSVLPDNFYILQTSADSHQEHSGLPVSDCGETVFSHRTSQKSYPSVVITGLDQTPDQLPALSASCINIVMLHGLIGSFAASHDSDGTMAYSLKELQGKHIDYIAAGHLHQFQYGKLDSRGVYCYSGCLEGRGFDECGEKGFVLLTVTIPDETTEIPVSKQLSFEFVPFASRSLYEQTVNLTDCSDHTQMESLIDSALASIDNRHLVKLTLEGQLPLQTELHTEWFRQKYQDDFYYFRLEDHTKPLITYEDYQYDHSLRGEFIRLVLSSSQLSEAEKEAVILEGLHALSGEEIMVH